MQANKSTGGNSGVAEGVLEVARELLRELGSERALRNLSLGASLERGLGLGSLERVELVSRIEAAFSVSLPEGAAAEAETLNDLIAATERRSPQASRELRPASPHSTAPRAPTQSESWGVAEGSTTLNEALLRHAEASPEGSHIFLRNEDDSIRTITYGDLLRQATAVARALRQRGLERGQSVALMLPTSEDFFTCFMGVLLAGGVPVPLYPPFRADQIEDYTRRQGHILRNAEARLLVTFRRVEALAHLLRPKVPTLAGVLTPEDLISPEEKPDSADAPLRADEFPAPGPEDPALIQYTSGSTGEPKGVVLTHANLIANIRAIGAGLEVRPTDVGASWLPLYHDMGLIGAWLFPLYFGFPVVILSPLAFLTRPERWLWAIHHHRATISAAPNFAYELSVRKIPDRAIEGLDLSCWRVALNGAEAVSPETLEHFVRRFGPCGFRPGTMMPVYGLAESSVALCFPPAGREPRVDSVRRDRLTKEGIADPAESSLPGHQTRSTSTLRFVSVGRPLPEHEVRIVNEAGEPLGERVQGRIQFRGPSVTAGYFHNPQATRASLRDGWWDSGDLGYRAEGELFITGRVKDVIIKAGRNFYPHEIEEIAGQVQGVRQGCVAAFGTVDERMGTERLVVVAETRETEGKARDLIMANLTEQVSAALGIPPDVVALVPAHTVPKTSSGKLRRDACRRMYLAGRLTRRRLPAWVQMARLRAVAFGSWVMKGLRLLGSVTYTAYVISILLMTVPPGWLLILLTRNPRAAARLSRGWARLFLRLVGCPVQVEGAENLDGAGPFVLVSNHSSYIDIPVLMAALPREFLFVAKQEVFSWPIVGTIVKKAGHLPVDRLEPSESLAGTGTIEETLRKGTSVLLFPEGTFTPATGLRPFKLGAFEAAVATSTPVCPVILRGTRQVLRDKSWLPRRGPIRLIIRPPIRGVHPKENHWREVVRLRDATRAEIVTCSGEEPLDLIAAGLPPVA